VMFVLVSMGLLRLPPVENVTSHVANEYDSSVLKYRMFFLFFRTREIHFIRNTTKPFVQIFTYLVQYREYYSPPYKCLQLTSFINYVE